MKNKDASASTSPLIGLFGEPRNGKCKSAVDWFVFVEDDCKHVGTGDEALDLAMKAVHRLTSEGGVPTGRSRHDRQLRAWRLEIAVEMTRAREHRRRLTPKQRSKLDASFKRLDAAFNRHDAALERPPGTRNELRSLR